MPIDSYIAPTAASSGANSVPKPSLRLRLLASVLSFAVATGGFGPSFSAAWAQTYQPAPQPGYQAAPAPGGANAPQQAPDPSGGEVIWPRQITSGDLNIFVYQPQVEAWDNGRSGRIEMTAAVGAQRGNGNQNFGTVRISARTDLDQAQRMVVMNDIQVVRADFPTATQLGDVVDRAIEQQAGQFLRAMPQEQVQASLDYFKIQQAQQTIDVGNEPPQILFSTSPSVLVAIDGDPIIRPIPNNSLQRVINTNALLLQDPASRRFILRAGGQWASAPGLEGPWIVESGNNIGVLDRVKEQELRTGRVDLLDDDDRPAPGNVLPDVYVATVPTELLQTDGPPQYEPIAGTRLLFVANSASEIFVDTNTQDFYVLISGRWFRAPNVDGPWSFIAAKQLPEDFRRIPPGHPKGDVLVSIAGTPQAREAVIANSIPQTAAIDPSKVRFQPVYDGEPQFQPVEGTPLHYAANAPYPVIRVNPQTYYAVYDGVWFTAPAPAGPWVVAYEVPPVIYTIPPRAPIYYATYVRVYGYRPGGLVYVGYTPGYFGTYVSRYDSVVVYGSGYRYRPWVQEAYYAPPPTYGFGAGFVAGAFTGFAVGLATAAFISEPHWGPYYSWNSDRRDRFASGGRNFAGGSSPRSFQTNVYNNTTINNVTINRTTNTTTNNTTAAPAGLTAAQSGAVRQSAAAQQAAAASGTQMRAREQRVQQSRQESSRQAAVAARTPATGTTTAAGTTATPAAATRGGAFVGNDGRVKRSDRQTQAGRTPTGTQTGTASGVQAGAAVGAAGVTAGATTGAAAGAQSRADNRWRNPTDADRTRTPGTRATPVQAQPGAQPAQPATQTPSTSTQARPGQTPGQVPGQAAPAQSARPGQPLPDAAAARAEAQRKRLEQERAARAARQGGGGAPQTQPGQPPAAQVQPGQPAPAAAPAGAPPGTSPGTPAQSARPGQPLPDNAASRAQAERLRLEQDRAAKAAQERTARDRANQPSAQGGAAPAGAVPDRAAQDRAAQDAAKQQQLQRQNQNRDNATRAAQENAAKQQQQQRQQQENAAGAAKQKQDQAAARAQQQQQEQAARAARQQQDAAKSQQENAARAARAQQDQAAKAARAKQDSTARAAKQQQDAARAAAAAAAKAAPPPAAAPAAPAADPAAAAKPAPAPQQAQPPRNGKGGRAKPDEGSNK